MKLPEVSGKLLDDKLQSIVSTGAEVVTALDMSCLTHLSGGAKRRGMGFRFIHLAGIMAEALGEGQP